MNKQPKKSIKLALQGGGSHGAFAWGVLYRLLEAVSGTSAGIERGRGPTKRRILCRSSLESCAAWRLRPVLDAP